MSLPVVVAPAEWRTARLALLVEENSFNYDFHVTLDEAVAPIEYNYRSEAELKAAGFTEMTGDLHGTSVFLRDGDRVFHTYSTYGRGTEQVGGTHYYLDLTALGRQEAWELPAERADLQPTLAAAGTQS